MIYLKVPESERDIDGIMYFSDLAQTAIDTNWGLPPRGRGILNLAYRVVVAEAAAVRVAELEKEVKGLRLTVARYKKNA